MTTPVLTLPAVLPPVVLPPVVLPPVSMPLSVLTLSRLVTPFWSGWGLLALVAAIAVALLVVPGPLAARRRLRAQSETGRDRPSSQRGTGGWVGRLSPRAGAMSLRRRVVLSVPAGAAMAMALGSLVHRTGPWQVLVLVVLTGAGVVALGQIEGQASRRSRERLIKDLPQCWELLSACLGAGLPLRTALAEVVAVEDGELAETLRHVLQRMRLGEPDTSAWRSIADHPQLGGPARDLARSVESGILVAGLLDEYAEQAREERHGQAQTRAKAIGVSAVLPLMICFLPAFFLVGVVPIVAGALLPLLSGW